MTPDEPIPEPPSHWTLDKRIPLALLIMIGAQTGTAVWWASSLSSRVTSLEMFASDAGARRTARDQVQLDLAGRIIRLETNNANTEGQLKTINEKLDRLIERKPL